MSIERFTITLTAEPGWSIPPDLRLRKLLKNALRGYGLKALEIGSQPVIETDEQRRERLRQQAIEIDADWNRRNGF
ncbi:MAG: hypothetical protein JWM11_5862 [Planctomycetaceae bacterium]|nr:hypothetical protein [Planctomycetaceae bacterium]